MAFVKRDVKDRVVQYPRRYQLVEVQPGIFDLIPVTGTVTEEGTPINKAYLQPIEDALEEAVTKEELNSHLADNVSQSEIHGIRVNNNKQLEYFDGENWNIIKGINPSNYYYYLGNEFIDNTGGWVEGLIQGDGNVAKYSEYLNMQNVGVAGATRRHGYETNNLIDLSNIKTLYVDWENLKGTTVGSRSNLYVANEKGSYLIVAETVISKVFTRTISTLDVSTLTGSYYIGVRATSSLDESAPVDLNVYRVWGGEI